MKPIAEQIESITAPALAAVRASYSELRNVMTRETTASEKAAESRARADKDSERVAKLTAEVQRLRLEVGQHLVEARKNWPIRGPRAKGWGEFLGSEGLSLRVAYDMMQLAGYVAEQAEEDIGTDVAGSDIPSRREVNAARRTARDREEQPDPIDPELAADQAAVEETGRVEIISAGSAFNIHLGDWRQTLADIGMVDAVICDPPYGKTTHESVTTRDDNSNPHGLTPDYEYWTADDVSAFVETWAPRCRGWFVALTSDDLIPAWRAAYRANELTAFAPVPCVIRGMSVRIQGDGPSSWAVYAMVARPANLSRWRTLPGAYIGGRVHGSKSGRGKPPWLMEQIVWNYTNPGDLVCDPFAGYGETLLAAWKLCRRQVGSEMVDTARREAIKRFHERKDNVVDLSTYDPFLGTEILGVLHDPTLEAGTAA